MSKKRKVEATAEEQEIMKRAEAKAAAIDNKPTVVEEETTVVEPKQKPIGVTVVEGAPSGMPGNEKQEATYQQKTTVFTPEQANSEALQKILNDEKQDVAVNNLLNADKNAKTEILGSITDPNTTLEDINQINQTADAASDLIKKDQTNLVNATSRTLGTLGDKKEKPDYDAFATKEDVKKGIDEYMAEYAKDAPASAIEKLGVQDYYPQIGRDVAVGTFTGSRIGSQTIYSGAGVLLPQGLYDARKRALAEEAKQRQKDLDKYLTIHNTADQFNERFAEIAGKAAFDVAERNGWNPNRIGRDREGMIELKKLENRGKRIIEADKQIDAFLEASNPKDGKPQAYIPEKMKNEMYKFKNGLIDNVDDYLTGKKDIGEFLENFRIYSDGTIWIDENFPKWTNESNKTQRSISLKTGKELTDQNIKEINETIKALQNDGNPDYDTYATILKKYFSIDDKRVDSWMNAQQYPKDDLARESVKEYLNNLIPAASFVEELKSNPNQNFGRWAKKMDLSIEKEKNKTFFTRLQDEANRQNIAGKVNGISLNWNTKSQDQKQNELALVYQGLGVVTKNPKNKKDAYAEIKVDATSSNASPVILSKSNQNAMIELRTADGKRKEVSMNDAARLLNKDSDYSWINGVKYYIPKNSDEFKDIQYFKINDQVPVISNVMEARAGHYGSDGRLYNLSTDNLTNYTKSNKKTLVITVEGNPARPENVQIGTDDNGKPIYEQQWKKTSSKIRYAGDNNDEQIRTVFDKIVSGEQPFTGGTMKQPTPKQP
jgi:hypothetical protein